MQEERESKGEPEIRQEEDRLPVRGILWTATALVALSAAAVAVAGGWALASASPPSPPAGPRGAGEDVRVGGVLQTPIAPPRSARPAPPPEEGARFAWADREEGLVRIPLEDALELYLREQGR